MNEHLPLHWVKNLHMHEIVLDPQSDEYNCVRKKFKKENDGFDPVEVCGLLVQKSLKLIIQLLSSSLSVSKEITWYNTYLLNYCVSNDNCKQILRVQNRELYLQYQEYKRRVERECGKKYEASHSIEREVWHGTSAAVVKSVCTKEFNRSFSRCMF